MADLSRESVENFKEYRKKSPLCKLLLGDRQKFTQDFNGVELQSIAFKSFRKEYILKIDSIFKDFDIENKATKYFKNSLKEEWLDANDDHRRSQLLNRVYSSLAELIVANILSTKGEKIEQLSALDKDCKSDIISKSNDDNQKYYSEVKYLGELPEDRQLTLDAIRRNGVEVNHLPSPEQIYNYYCIRIADAVSQMEKAKIPLQERRVFLVIDSSNNIELLEQTVIEWIISNNNWFNGRPWDSLVTKLKLTNNQLKYRDKSVDFYTKETKELVIVFLDKFSIGREFLVK
jgi:Uri superfamily endonuclease